MWTPNDSCSTLSVCVRPHAFITYFLFNHSDRDGFKKKFFGIHSHLDQLPAFGVETHSSTMPDADSCGRDQEEPKINCDDDHGFFWSPLKILHVGESGWTGDPRGILVGTHTLTFRPWRLTIMTATSAHSSMT